MGKKHRQIDSSGIEFIKSSLIEILGEEENDFVNNFISEYREIITGTSFTEEYIGSNGFAQVGSSDYYEKQQIERDILFKYITQTIGEVPSAAELKWKSNDHDFGEYHEFVFIYSMDIKSHLTYLNKLLDIDLESESLTEMIKQYYNEQKEFNDYLKTIENEKK